MSDRRKKLGGGVVGRQTDREAWLSDDPQKGTILKKSEVK